MSLEFVEKGEYVEVNGVKLYVYDSAKYRKYESPLSIIFLHGMPGQLSNWKYQVPFFEEKFRVVAYDQRGYGRSDKPKKVSMDDYVSDLKELLGKLGIKDEDAVLVGHSFGGMVAQAYARKHVVKGLVLVGSVIKLHVDALDYIIKYTPEFIWKPIFFTANPLTKSVYSKMFLSPKSPLDVLMEFFQDNADYLKELPASTYRYVWYLLDYDASKWLHEIKSPTLVVVGEDDAVTPPSVSRRIHELIPNSKLVVIKEAGHLVLYEKPDELNKVILEFVESLQ